MNKGVFFILIVLLFPMSGADVISINSGGSNNIVINPDNYIEGFFSCIPYTCASLGYNCGTWDDGCGGTLNCGTCSSGYTCTSGICVYSGGGGEGPSGGGAVSTITALLVSPTELNINLAINTAVDRTITVKNLGTSSVNVSITQENLNDMIILNTKYLYLLAGETKNFNARFVAPNEPGIYTGKIFIGSKQVLVSLNVKTLLLLFDSNIVVLNEDYKVGQGDELKTQVTLIPLGDKERMDVTLNYVIKDYKNKVYLTKKETLLVEEQVDFKRNFDTGILPIGKYIVGLELVYPGGIAPSSAHFEVIEKLPISFFGKIVYFLMIMILLILIIIVALLIRRFVKKKKEQGVS